MTTKKKLISLAEAAAVVPGGAGVPTIWRWCTRGLRARGRGAVRLRHVRVGGRVYTRVDWVADFLRRVSRMKMKESAT